MPSLVGIATGFSQKAGRPARTAAAMNAGCVSVEVAMTTPLTPASSSPSYVSTGSAAYSAAALASGRGIASVTTIVSTTGSSSSVCRWKVPILPSPAKPMRMVGSPGAAGDGGLRRNRDGQDRGV